MKSKTTTSMLLIILILCITLPISNARIFDRIIAFVNDDVITKRRLDLVVKQRAFELQQMHRYTESEALKEAEKEREELLDGLIRQMLVLEAALTLKVEVTNVEIEEQIQKYKNQFQISSDEDFKKLLNREGLTLASFREQLQRNLMTEKLVMGRILPRLQVRDSDVQKFFEENRDQLPTKADRVHLRKIFIAYKPSEAEKKTAYDEVNQALTDIKTDKTQFQAIARSIATKHNLNTQVGFLIETTPAEILSYPNAFLTVLSKLKAGEISEPIEAEDGYHVFMVETRTDEKITFRHLTVPFSFSQEVIQNAKDMMQNIVKKLEAGESFAELAKLHSDDIETKTNEGDMGIHTLTELNPIIRKIVEPLEVGKFSETLELDNGLHIYKVENRETPELTPQEKQQIIGILRQQLFEKEWTAYTDSLLENAYIKIKPDAVPSTETKEK